MITKKIRNEIIKMGEEVNLEIENSGSKYMFFMQSGDNFISITLIDISDIITQEIKFNWMICSQESFILVTYFVAINKTKGISHIDYIQENTLIKYVKEITDLVKKISIDKSKTGKGFNQLNTEQSISSSENILREFHKKRFPNLES